MCFFKRFKINRLNKKLRAFQSARVHNPPGEEALKKELACYMKLAGLYHGLIGHKKYPFARELWLESYRGAASIDDPESLFVFGKQMLEEGKFRAALQAEGLFASPSNERQSNQLFEEAHAYLLAAEKLKHIQAKRLRGLAYINGWGVPADKEQGFEWVVESIEQENSWDKVPQIFASLGLNKPEFFSALAQRRHPATG